MPQINGEWIDHEEIEVRVAEGWKRILEKMGGASDALEKLVGEVANVRKSVDLVNNEFDALGPLLDALAEDEGTDEYGTDDVEDMEG